MEYYDYTSDNKDHTPHHSAAATDLYVWTGAAAAHPALRGRPHAAPGTDRCGTQERRHICTVRENIAYGNLDATEEEIIAAAKKANIHDYIVTLDKGYDTEVGERGIKLSGGQRQRIAIARVFLKNPKLLIHDEATSALDNATEMQIQASLEELSRGRTVIVVAHRLSTIKNADEIVVIGNSGIIEQGTHDELIANDGEYRKLYEYQFRTV